MTISILSKDKVQASIKSIALRGKNFDTDVHNTAVQCLLHAKQHGDVSLMAKLVTVMPKSSRQLALIEWVNTFSPIVLRRNPKTKMFEGKLVKGYTDANFKIDEANNTAFYDLTSEREPTQYTSDTFIRRLEGMIKAIERASENYSQEDMEKSRLDELKQKFAAFNTELRVNFVDANPNITH